MDDRILQGGMMSPGFAPRDPLGITPVAISQLERIAVALESIARDLRAVRSDATPGQIAKAVASIADDLHAARAEAEGHR